MANCVRCFFEERAERAKQKVAEWNTIPCLARPWKLVVIDMEALAASYACTCAEA